MAMIRYDNEMKNNMSSGKDEDTTKKTDMSKIQRRFRLKLNRWASKEFSTVRKKKNKIV